MMYINNLDVLTFPRIPFQILIYLSNHGRNNSEPTPSFAGVKPSLRFSMLVVLRLVFTCRSPNPHQNRLFEVEVAKPN